MKMRMRVLSILVCLALLMSAAPVDLRLAAGLATEAEGEVEAAPVEEIPAGESAADSAPEQAVSPDEGDAAPEPPSEEAADADSSAAGDAGAEGEDDFAADAPGETEDPTDADDRAEAAAVDYAADASASPAFTEGYAEVLRDGAPLYADESAEAEVKATLDKGVVYATKRSVDAGGVDRLRVAFNAGAERGVDAGWIDAAQLRPMEPEREVSAFFDFCENLEGVIYSEALNGLPLARISCAYPEANPEVQTEVDSEAAEAEAEHPVIDFSAVEPEIVEVEPVEAEDVQEPGISTMPLPLEDPLFRLEDVVASIAQDSIELCEGETQQLDLELSEGATPVLTSSDESVATVSEAGVVTAIGPGEATITMVVDDLIDVCAVNVALPVIHLQADTLYLGEGENFDLVDRKFVQCTSEDEEAKIKLIFELVKESEETEETEAGEAAEECVSVSGSGVITAKREGTAKVKVTELNSGQNATLTVVVRKVAQSVSICDSLTLSVGMSADLGIAFSPENTYSSYTLTSDDEGVATVDAATGKVTAVAAGSATVTVEMNGALDTCFVTVLDLPGAIVFEENPIVLSQSERGKRIVARAYAQEPDDGVSFPEPIPCEFTYEVNEGGESIVTVGEDGMLTPGAFGSATVTVTVKGTDVSAECTVTVTQDAASISLGVEEITLGVGDTFQISDGRDGIIELEPLGSYVASYSYESTEPDIVSVSAEGLITAKKAGYADITITPENMEEGATLTVSVKKLASSISFNIGEMVMEPGEFRDDLEVSFPSGTYADYTVYILGGDFEDPESAPVEIFPLDAVDVDFPIEDGSKGFPWMVSASESITEPTSVFLVAETKQGAHTDICQVRVLPTPQEGDIEIVEPKLEEGEALVLGMGEEASISARFTRDVSGTIFYESADDSKVAVDMFDGTIHANAVTGEEGVEVFAKSSTSVDEDGEGGEVSASIRVVVVSYPTKFELNHSELKLGVGDLYDLAEDPAGLMNIEGGMTRFSYKVTSGGTSGSVSSDGVISATKAGTMNVEITPASGALGVTAKTLKVTVSNAASSISLSDNYLRVGMGMKGKSLSVTFPAKTYGYFDAASSDPAVLEVERDGESVLLKPVAPGRATVKVQTAKGCADSCVVEVVKAPESVTLNAPAAIAKGEAGRSVEAVYDEANSLADIIFISNNPGVLEVDRTTGALTAKSDLKVNGETGAVMISAYLNEYKGDGSDEPAASASIKIYDGPGELFVNPSSLTLAAGKTYQITYGQPGDMVELTRDTSASLSFKSNNAAIAAVSATGLIEAKKVGSTTILISSQNNVSKSLSVKVVKDFTIKSDKAELGVGMSGKLTASGAPKGWEIEYSCEPEGAVKFNADGTFTAQRAGAAFLVAKAFQGEEMAEAEKKVSNAVALNVLRAPTKDEIVFSETSAGRIGPNQKNASVTAACAAGTMAEIGYRLEGDPYGVDLDADKGALTVGDCDPYGSFTVIAYDKNSDPEVSNAWTVQLTGSALISGLKSANLSLVVGETYFVTDGPDGIIVLEGDDPESGEYSAGSYAFKRVSGTNGVVTWSAAGLFTAKKAGTEKVRITSHLNSKNYVDLTFKVTKNTGAASIQPSVLRLAVGMESALTLSSNNLQLSCSDGEVAQLDEWGNVTAVGAGSAILTAADPQTGSVDTALVEVVEAPSAISFAEGLQDESGLLIMGKGESGVKLTAEIEAPSDGGLPVGTIEYALDCADADELKEAQKYVTVNAATGALTAKKVTYNSTDEQDYPIQVIARIKEYPDVVTEPVSVSVVAKTAISLVTEDSDPEKPTALKSIKLGIGNTYQLGMFGGGDEDAEDADAVHGVIKLTPENVHAQISYKSSNANIAEVSADGLITAKAAGTAKVRVSTQSGRYADLSVQVCKLPVSVSLSASSLRLGVKMSGTLAVNFLEKNAYDSYTLTSNNEEVATVDAAGRVTGISEGTAVITVRTTTKDDETGGYLSDNCLVEVVPGAGEFTVSALRGTRNFVEENVDSEGLTMSIGESKVQLIAVPEEGESGMAEFTFALDAESETYAADKKKLAVNATTGVLTASKVTEDPIAVLVRDKNDPEGTPVRVEVTILPKPAAGTMLLTQKTLVLGVNETFQISDYDLETGEGIIIMDEEDCRASYSYKSNKTAVATVSAEGLITAKKAGSAVITIATQNANVSQKLTVTVCDKATGLTIPAAAKLGSNMTATIAPTFSPAKSYGEMEVEVLGKNSDKLEAFIDTSVGAIVLNALEIEEKSSATIRVRLKGTEVADTCLVTLLPAPKEGEIEIDYASIPAAAKDEKGNDIILVSQNEAGVKIVAKCVNPSEAMCDFTYSLRGNIEGLKIDPDTGELTIGYKEGKTTYTVAPGTYENAIVATAMNGLAIGPATASATLKVVAPPNGIYFHASSDKPKESSYTLQMGVNETYAITEYMYDKATGEENGLIVLDPEGSSASYTYKTGNAAVAAVSADGIITAKKVGSASITVKAQNGKSRAFTVKVVAAPKTVALEPARQELGENSNGKVALSYPDGGCSLAKSFESTDPDLLYVRPDGTFSIGLLPDNDGQPQDVNITVTTQSGQTAYATVTVLPRPTSIHFAQDEYTISVGMTAETSLAPFTPGQMAQKFKYASSDEGVVKIDPETGAITGVKSSETPVTITVTANYDVEKPGYQVSGTAHVIVEPAPGYLTYEGTGLPDQPLKLMKDDEMEIPEPRAFENADMEKELSANYSFSLKNSSDKSYLTITGNRMKAVKARDADIVIVVEAHNSTAARPVRTELKVRIYDEKPTGLELYFGDRKVNDKTLEMYVNAAHPVDSIALTSKIIGANANFSAVTYESSNEKYVTVDANGVITALCDANGTVPSGTTATITAKKCFGTTVAAEATCTVKLGRLCDSVALADTSFTLQEGEQRQIAMNFTPTAGSGMRFSYESDNTDAVTVDESGMLKAVGGGEATITVTGQYGMLSPNKVSVQVLYSPDSIALPVRKLYMKPGQTVELTPALARTGVEAAAKVNQYTEVSANTNHDGAVKIETKVPMDQAGGKSATYLVTAVAEGGRTFTFKTYNGLEAVCEIRVVSADALTDELNSFGWDEDAVLYIIRGDSAELEYGLTVVDGAEEGAPGTISSYSLVVEDADILQVEGGRITALQTGKTKLKLTVNGSVTDWVTINVIPPVKPALYYGEGFKNPVQPKNVKDEPDVILYSDDASATVDYGNHEILIDPLPDASYDKNGVLLGTFEVEQEPDANLLLFDRSRLVLRATAKAGETYVTVKTHGSEIRAFVRVESGAPKYRALLISEYNTKGGSSKLPFSNMNVVNMKAALERSEIDGAKYETKTLIDPSEASIKSNIESFFKDTKENDISVIYVVAHGHMGSGSAKGQYCFSLGSYVTKTLSTYVTDSELMGWIESYTKGRVVLMLDSCHSAGFIDHQRSIGGLAESGRIAVLAAQIANNSASFYVGSYKNVETYEFFTRALHISLGYNINRGSGDDWNSAEDGDVNGDGMYTLSETFDRTKRLTMEMVDKYAWKDYFSTSNKGFKAPSVNSTSDGANWRMKITDHSYQSAYGYPGLGQVPQCFIPDAMADMVIVGTN